EAEERELVFAHVGVDEQADGSRGPAGLRPLELVEGRERDRDLVADAADVDERALGGDREQGAGEQADHGARWYPGAGLRRRRARGAGRRAGRRGARARPRAAAGPPERSYPVPPRRRGARPGSRPRPGWWRW